MNKITILLIISMIILTGCGATGNVVSDNTIKVGFMSMMTGPYAMLGEQDLNAAKMALEELGYEGKIELIVEDAGTLGGTKDAITAYRKLVDLDKVQVIIAPLTSDSLMALAPLVDEDKVVMITPSTGGQNIDEAAEYLFRNGPSDIKAGSKPAKDIYEKLKLTNVAIFTDNAEYTIDISYHFKQEFKGNLVVDEKLEVNSKDFKTEVLKVAESNAEVIVINSANGISSTNFVKQLYEAGNTKPIFVNYFGYNPTVADKTAFEGAYIYAPEFDEESQATEKFLEKYVQIYGKEAPIQFHATGTYDALKMTIESIESVGYDGEKIHDYLLENIKDWKGLNGRITFDEQGNADIGVIPKQIIGGSLVSI